MLTGGVLRLEAGCSEGGTAKQEVARCSARVEGWLRREGPCLAGVGPRCDRGGPSSSPGYLPFALPCARSKRAHEAFSRRPKFRPCIARSTSQGAGCCELHRCALHSCVCLAGACCTAGCCAALDNVLRATSSVNEARTSTSEASPTGGFLCSTGVGPRRARGRGVGSPVSWLPKVPCSPVMFQG